MADLKQMLAEHSDRLDAVMEEFTGRLQIMIERSRKALLEDLHNRLTLDGKKIMPGAANQRIVGNIDTMFLNLLEKEGYSSLVSSFTESFGGQLPVFQEVIDHINEGLLFPLPAVTFGSTDLSEFAASRVTANGLITDVVNKVASNAKRQAVLAMGGLDVRALAEEISNQLGKGVNESAVLAETSISSYYRMVTDRGFQIIEEDLPGYKIRYQYEGPLDKLNRPFCLKMERLARQGKTYTRAEILKMDNGQISNVFITGGGYRCRHQWIIAVSDLRAQQERKGPVAPPKNRPRTVESVGREVRARKALSDSQLTLRAGTRPTAASLRTASNASLENIRARKANRA